MEKTTIYGLIFIAIALVLGSIAYIFGDLVDIILVVVAFAFFTLGFILLLLSLDKKFKNKSKLTRVFFWIFSIYSLILILFLRIGMSMYASYLFPNMYDSSWFIVITSVFVGLPIFLTLLALLSIALFIDKRKSSIK